MKDLTYLSNHVIDEIKNTDEYRDYIFVLNRLKENPELYEKVNALRQRNFEIQVSGSGDALEEIDQLTNDYEDVINNELVDAFLGAEAAFCRMMQQFNMNVTKGLEFE